MTQIILLVLDGLSDGTPSDLACRTTLQDARKPVLDSLARTGMTGTIYPVSRGFVPETDTGMLSLLGYDVRSLWIKRAPIEWYALVGSFSSGSVAFRVNFATLHNDGTVDRDSGKTVTQNEAQELVDGINQALASLGGPLGSCLLRNTTTYQAAALLLVQPSRGFRPSEAVSNTDPWYPVDSPTSIPRTRVQFCPVVRSVPLDSSEGARLTASLLNQLVHATFSILKEHPLNLMRVEEGKKPVNYLLLRHPGGELPSLEPLPKRFGLEFAFFVDLNLERGIALLTRATPIQIRSVKAHSLDPEVLATDYRWLADDILVHQPSHDVLVAHIKGPDKAAHLGDREKKIQVIELIDKYLLGNLVSRLDLERVMLCVTSDHATPWYLKLHSDDKVPILIRGPSIQPDTVAKFDEFSCREGQLPITRGEEVLPFLVNSLPSRLVHHGG